MSSKREIVAVSIVLGADGGIEVRPEFVRAHDPMGERQPLEIAASKLNFPLPEVLEAMRRGFIPSTQDASGLRVVLLRDVIEGVRRLREEGSQQ